MPPVKTLRPAYAQSFHCIGAACEDTCCHGWNVPVDREIFEKYRQLPDSPQRTQILSAIELAPADAASSDGYGAEAFAKLRMDSKNQCPMLNENRLCGIQSQYGQGLLPQTCAVYPRIVRRVGGQEEQLLAFSCPEAARQLLLSPIAFLEQEEDACETDASTPPHFWEIRQTVIRLVHNRTYPLWERMFLLGILCRRLDSIAAGELKRSVPGFLADFERSVASGRLRRVMEAQPVDRKVQLDAVLRLAGLMLHKSNVTPRFVECINRFAAGIGNGPTATLETLTDRFTLAHDRYFAPFFGRHPQILENYLINTILRCQFPFGREAMQQATVPGGLSMTREFAILTAQFALTKGLLIGVAGFQGESFSGAHVVHTVQASSKHFDHHPDFPKLAYELLVESHLDGVRGMSILLRNTDAKVLHRPATGLYVPEPLAEAAN